jgi:1-acyl-sn-glycerol-3-phosphate acyltransferase
MKKILGYICTTFFYLAFGLILGIFHLVQVVCWNLWGYKAHKISVDIFNFMLVKSLSIMGASVRFAGFNKLPQNKPLIIIANHQSMFDIPPIVWGFRKHHAKFISKKELGHGIPSISYNLRKGGSALIDRKNPQQAMEAIRRLGRKIEDHNYSAVIFPEGTRGRDGQVKKFKSGGIKALLDSTPSAVIVPFVIDGNYKLQESGAFPLSFGLQLSYTVLDPFYSKELSADEVTERSEYLIKKHLGQI